MAASKDFAVLDLQNDSEGLDVDLQFQDFGDARTPAVGAGSGSGKHEQTIHFTEFPDSAEDELEQEKVSPKRKKLKMEFDTTPILSVLSTKVNVHAVLQESELGKVDLVQVAVVQVKEKKFTSRAIKELSMKLPVPLLSHLKRVRKIIRTVGLCEGGDSCIKPEKEDALLIYLDLLDNFGVPYSDTFDDDNISSLSSYEGVKVLDKLRETDIDISLFEDQVYASRVAKFAPRIRKLYEHAILFWPCTFHEDAYLTQLYSSNFFNEEEVQLIGKFMNKAIQLGQEANKNGSPAIGALIVDSHKGVIVGQGIDSRHKHPLQHAVMLAIDNVAHHQGGGAWLGHGLQLQVGNSFEKHFKSSADDELEAINEISCIGETESDVIQKTQEESHNRKNHIVREEYLIDNPNQAEQIVSKSCTGESLSYICTGYDVYLTHEPCMMCAMALLHSRVRRIFYVCSQAQIGALGSRTKLHTLPGINHRYEVFVVSEKTSC